MTIERARRALPAEYHDPRTWPDIEDSVLNDTEHADEPRFVQARRLRQALLGYLRGEPVKMVCRESGIQTSSLYHALNKCVQTAADGNILGFRALLTSSTRKDYVRKARLPVPCDDSRGLAGAFALFLLRYPKVKGGLDAYIEQANPKPFPSGTRFSTKNAYDVFTKLCAQEAITQYDYPFWTSDRGRRAVARYVATVLQHKFSRQARIRGGVRAALLAKTGTGHPRHRFDLMPFDRVSIDAKRLDAIGVVQIETYSLTEFIPISRLQFIPVVENGCGAILGYSVAIRREATAFDAMRAIQHSLTPWTPRSLSLEGLAYPAGAMLPSALPQAAGICWASIVLDNATIHYSHAISQRLPRVLGCALNWGPVNAWYHNPISEAVFSALDRRGFHRLPNTTGTGPHDPLRGDAAQRAVDFKITWVELFDLIDLVVCDYNCGKPDALNGRSRIEYIRDALREGIWIPRRLPSTTQIADLDTVEAVVHVRGNTRAGRRPHVNFWNVPYTSPILADSPNLIGTKLTIRARESDPRKIRAYLPNGSELGFLTAPGQWGITLHTRTFRKEVIRAHKSGEVPAPLHGADIIATYLRIKQQNALREKAVRRKNDRPKISAEATALARGIEATGASVSIATATHRAPPQTTSGASLPSFIPTLNHRSVSK